MLNANAQDSEGPCPLIKDSIHLKLMKKPLHTVSDVHLIVQQQEV